jgi:hypothetical protein
MNRTELILKCIIIIEVILIACIIFKRYIDGVNNNDNSNIEGFNNDDNSVDIKNEILDIKKYNPAKKNIYCFWTGINKMSKNRQQCLQTIYNNTGIEVKFITTQNLNNYILNDAPLHKGYKYLSEVHKSDYLRCYFMHFYGGGYTDIKQTNINWNKYFDKLNNSDKWCIGYAEIPGGSSTNLDYTKLIGNGCYIFKPMTPITTEWYNELIKKMDSKYEELKKNPANTYRDYQGYKLENGEYSKYPLAWAELLCDIFHVIIYKYNDKVYNDMPLINTSNYI